MVSWMKFFVVASNTRGVEVLKALKFVQTIGELVFYCEDGRKAFPVREVLVYEGFETEEEAIEQAEALGG